MFSSWCQHSRLQRICQCQPSPILPGRHVITQMEFCCHWRHRGDHPGGCEELAGKQVQGLELSHSRPGGSLASMLTAVSTISSFSQAPPKKTTETPFLKSAKTWLSGLERRVHFRFNLMWAGEPNQMERWQLFSTPHFISCQNDDACASKPPKVQTFATSNQHPHHYSFCPIGCEQILFMCVCFNSKYRSRNWLQNQGQDLIN